MARQPASAYGRGDHGGCRITCTPGGLLGRIDARVAGGSELVAGGVSGCHGAGAEEGRWEGAGALAESAFGA